MLGSVIEMFYGCLWHGFGLFRQLNSWDPPTKSCFFLRQCVVLVKAVVLSSGRVKELGEIERGCVEVMNTPEPGALPVCLGYRAVTARLDVSAPPRKTIPKQNCYSLVCWEIHTWKLKVCAWVSGICRPWHYRKIKFDVRVLQNRPT